LSFFLPAAKKEVKDSADSGKPYVVMLSLDGFRWDYTKNAHTPVLDSLKKAGIFAEMIPSFPTKTFPNHYSIATGLYPDHGMGPISNDREVILDHYIDTANLQYMDGGNPVYNLGVKPGKLETVYQKLKKIPHIKVWKHDSLPARLHYETNIHTHDLTRCGRF